MDRLNEIRTAIADNTVPGGSAFGRAAAEVIALTLAQQHVSGDRLAQLLDTTSEWLVATKPSMTSVRTVTTLAADTLHHTGSREAVIAAMTRFVDESEASISKIADHAEAFIKPGSTVLFHSYSGSLLQILGRAAAQVADLTFLFTESRPYRESLRIAASLAETPVKLIAVSDASMAAAADEADLAVVGADALFRDGSYANKIGSLPLALSCKYAGTPHYVVTELSKLYPGDPDDIAMELRPPEELAGDWELWQSGRVTVRNQFFERVPAELVTAYLTDQGALTPDELGARATS